MALRGALLLVLASAVYTSAIECSHNLPWFPVSFVEFKENSTDLEFTPLFQYTMYNYLTVWISDPSEQPGLTGSVLSVFKGPAVEFQLSLVDGRVVVQRGLDVAEFRLNHTLSDTVATPCGRWILLGVELSPARLVPFVASPVRGRVNLGETEFGTGCEDAPPGGGAASAVPCFQPRELTYYIGGSANGTSESSPRPTLKIGDFRMDRLNTVNWTQVVLEPTTQNLLFRNGVFSDIIVNRYSMTHFAMSCRDSGHIVLCNANKADRLMRPGAYISMMIFCLGCAAAFLSGVISGWSRD